MTSNKDSSDTESTSHENENSDQIEDEAFIDIGQNLKIEETKKLGDYTIETSDQENKEKECSSKWPRTIRKTTFVLAHVILILIPILLCYLSETNKTQRKQDMKTKYRNTLLVSLENWLTQMRTNPMFEWNLNKTDQNYENFTLPTALLAPKLVRWRLYSLWIFPFLVLPDITQNIWVFNADIHRKKRFDISILMLLIMSSLPIMSLIMASSTEPDLLCGMALDSDGLNLNLNIDVQKYAIFVSALIVVYRLLTRSRLMSRQEHLFMIQSFIGNAADMNEFLIASYRPGSAYSDKDKQLSFAVWLWASLQFCFSCTSEDDFLETYQARRSQLKSLSLFRKVFLYVKRKYCQYDEFVIPLLLNDIPLLIGRIVIFRQHLRQQITNQSQSSTQPLTHQLSYFFLMKNLLVVILSVGNMYLHCQDCRKRRLSERPGSKSPQIENKVPSAQKRQYKIFGYLPQKRFLQLCNYLSWIMGLGLYGFKGLKGCFLMYSALPNGYCLTPLPSHTRHDTPNVQTPRAF